jgi:hypothetical protein
MMVCNHCSSASHVTGYRECPNYCTVCKDVGHHRKSKACPDRTCPRCNTVGHSARECTFCSLCEQQGHKEANCPDKLCSLCEQQGHEEANCPDRLCSACNLSKHKTSRASDCPYHQCSTCDEIGHSEKALPAGRVRCVQSIWPRRYDLPISRLLGRRNRLADHPAPVSNATHDKRLTAQW